MVEHMLTTVDNPFNPFTEYDEWNAWDQRRGYDTESYLARVVVTSNDLSESEQSTAIEQAISEIVNENVSGHHIKLTFDEAAARFSD
jgi:hypothetical protein